MASRCTAAAGADGTSSGTNPSHGSVHSCAAIPSTVGGDRLLPHEGLVSRGQGEEPNQLVPADLPETKKLRHSSAENTSRGDTTLKV